MNQRLLLNLIAIPTLASSLLTLLLMPSRAATDLMVKGSAQLISSTPVSCDAPKDLTFNLSVTGHTLAGILMASAGEFPGEDLVSDFTAAESDAAVTLFGCDCLPCINALRLLRSNAGEKNAQGHCWSSLQQRVSPQQLQEVLQTLEAEDQN